MVYNAHRRSAKKSKFIDPFSLFMMMMKEDRERDRKMQQRTRGASCERARHDENES